MMVELRIGGIDHVRSGDDALEAVRTAVHFHVARLGWPVAWRLDRVSVTLRHADGWYARFDDADLRPC